MKRAKLVCFMLLAHTALRALFFALANAGNIMLPPKPPKRVKRTPTTGQMSMDITRPPTANPVPLSLLVGFLICTKATIPRMKPMQLSSGRNAMMNEATARPEVLGSVGMP